MLYLVEMCRSGIINMNGSLQKHKGNEVEILIRTSGITSLSTLLGVSTDDI